MEFHWKDPPKDSQNFLEIAHNPNETPLKISIRTHSIPAWVIWYVTFERYIMQSSRDVYVLWFISFNLYVSAKLVSELCTTSADFTSGHLFFKEIQANLHKWLNPSKKRQTNYGLTIIFRVRVYCINHVDIWLTSSLPPM